ncbi:MAG: type II toxin-antitoxin system prevent-host-death family antitoxin [Rhodospirillales bacterium]|nr:type II toxin-antitoxin system prevent-host-death family antitoxin [Rhodospirillales bacterium]
MTKVTSAEFQKKFGLYRDAAMRGPVIISNHGRDSLVLLSAHEFDRLKRRDRDVILTKDMTDEDLEAIVNAEWPEEAGQYDHELAE